MGLNQTLYLKSMNKIFSNTLFSCFCLAIIGLISISNAFCAPPGREIFELKIYHLDNKEQEERVDTFLKNAYIPALKRAGIEKVGVFKPVEDDDAEGKKIYVYIPYQSAEKFVQLEQILEKDQKYQAEGRGYIQTSHDNPAYLRMESILLQAFEGLPEFKESKLDNPPSERIYELRSYESATEKLFRNKVQMFNQGEIDIFERLGFNHIFYGEVLAGSSMPNLMYMTTHANMEARDKNWKAFTEDEQWEELSGMEEYQNNVSHIDIILLHPTPYSEI